MSVFYSYSYLIAGQNVEDNITYFNPNDDNNQNDSYNDSDGKIKNQFKCGCKGTRAGTAAKRPPEMDEDTPPFSSHRIGALLGNSTDRLVVGNGRSALLPTRVSELQLSAFNWRFLSSSTAVESSPCINKQSNRQRKQDIQIFS